MIYWDIDGVIRGLSQEIWGFVPDEWSHKVAGKTIVEAVNARPEICATAPPLEYLSVLNNQSDAKILSSQPDSWRHWTNSWLNRNVLITYTVQYVEDTKEKLGQLSPGDWLIDDSPIFEDFSQIILVDRPYNRSIECPNRVCSPWELGRFLSTR